jgi:copper transport protein
MVLPAVVVASALLATAGPVNGHALLKSSQPAAGDSLTAAPAQVTITFTETPDLRLSTISLVDSSGGAVQTGALTGSPTDPATLSVTLPTLADGVYTVTWRTVSSVDGHLATGSFAFGVGVAPPTQPASASASGSSQLSALGIAGRWLSYAGLLVLVGAAWLLWRTTIRTKAAGERDARALRTLLLIAAAAAAAGTLVVLFDQLSSAGVGLADVVGTSLGNAVTLRGLTVCAALVGALIVRWRAGRIGLLIAAIGVLAAMLVDVGLSHAGAGNQPIIDSAVQWLHLVAAGAWLGGLTALLVWLRYRAPDDSAADVARRFSLLATISIALVVITGVVRAVEEIGTIDALFGTLFGWLIIGKSALLIVLAALGALNHFLHVPRGVAGLGPLRKVGRAEVGVAAVIVLLTSALVNIAPPAETATASTPQQVTASGSDFGTTVRVALTVTPGTAGINTFVADVRDYNSGSSAGATAVTLRFALPAQPQVASSRLDLQQQPDSTFSATGTNLSIDGTWSVTAVVGLPNTAVEVPLEVTTRIVRQQVDVNRQPGLPTIYIVHLDAGGTVQMYLDPGTPGPNELHATFFDPQGNELPVTSVTESIGPEGQAAPPLTPRMLEPGHFVSDTNLQSGTYLATVIGTSPSGSGSLVAHADMDVSQ